eukprot:jgi/Chrzof1/902/Cz01g32370.t1
MSNVSTPTADAAHQQVMAHSDGHVHVHTNKKNSKSSVLSRVRTFTCCTAPKTHDFQTSSGDSTPMKRTVTLPGAHGGCDKDVASRGADTGSLDHHDMHTEAGKGPTTKHLAIAATGSWDTAPHHVQAETPRALSIASGSDAWEDARSELPDIFYQHQTETEPTTTQHAAAESSFTAPSAKPMQPGQPAQLDQGTKPPQPATQGYQLDSVAHRDQGEVHDVQPSTAEQPDAQQTYVPRSVGQLGQLAPWIPNSPLYFGDASMEFVPIRNLNAFAGYWLRDHARTTQAPLPLCVLLKQSAFMAKRYETIKGIWLQETPTQITVSTTATVGYIKVPYNEAYNKDSSEHTWYRRRDVVPGRSTGQVFLTKDNTMVFRVLYKGVWSDKVEAIAEDFITLENDGKTMVDKQCLIEMHHQQRAHQYIVGDYLPAPPPGHV